MILEGNMDSGTFMETIREPADKKRLREALAAYSHNAWAGYMEYFLGICYAGGDAVLQCPNWAATRCRRQIDTPYSELSDDEQDSDRAEADKMISIVNRHLDSLNQDNV